jgi:membrane associated rhomboid family serine protease
VAQLQVYGGSRLYEILHGEVWRLFMAVFLHAGIYHLFSNMLILVIVGYTVEPILRTRWMLVAYLCSGMMGNLISAVYHKYTITVGASGAIYGLFGILAALVASGYGTTRIRKTYVAMLLLYVGMGLVLGMAGNTDNAAHIGGLLTGFAIGLVYSYQHRNVVHTDVLLRA